MMRRTALPFLFVGLATFILVAWYARATWLELGNPHVVTGYTLFALMLLLGVFNVRKRMSMVPVGRGSLWLAFHVVAGVGNHQLERLPPGSIAILDRLP